MKDKSTSEPKPDSDSKPNNTMPAKATSGYLINLIDSPGHVDFSSEVTAALRVTDGSLVVVDAVESVCVQTETVLRQSISERIIPTLMLNKIDSLLDGLARSEEDMFMIFRKSIESFNVIATTYAEPGFDYTVDPEKGSVAFGSGLRCWGFTLPQMATFIAEKANLPESKILSRLWGEHFYSPSTKKWSTNQSADSIRGFCMYILQPIFRVYREVEKVNETNSLEAVQSLLKKMNITLSEDEMGLRDKNLTKCALRKMFPLADALLEMIVRKLPSPCKAQPYRCDVLYEGPPDDECAKAVKACDPNGPVMIYVSKMVPTSDKGRFYAFGRVFSGTINGGMKVRIQGPDYVQGEKSDLHEKPVQRTVLMMGRSVEHIDGCPCGNIVGLVGIDSYLVKSGTITTHPHAHNFKVMKFSVAPVVQIAVSVVNTDDLPKLTEGLRRLQKSDPCVQCIVNEAGEHIVAGAGELHLEICLNDLENDHAGVPIKRSSPVVQYRETIEETITTPVLARSSNGHNRVLVTAGPVDPDLVTQIETQKIQWTDDVKTRASLLVNNYGWESNDARKMWAFGPTSTCSNILVDSTHGIQYLQESRDLFISAFNSVTAEGAICGEQLRGCRFLVVDVHLHADAVHRGGNQLIPASRRAFQAAELSAGPALLEPLYLVTIQVPDDYIQGVFRTLTARRGEIIDTEQLDNVSQSIIRAYLPISESFGFMAHLRSNTGGRAFPQCVFDKWERVPGDVFDPTTMAGTIATEIRQRKGKKPEVPFDWTMQICF